ncbi:Ras family protein, partial [Reticulomyxa filosa]
KSKKKIKIKMNNEVSPIKLNGSEESTKPKPLLSGAPSTKESIEDAPREKEKEKGNGQSNEKKMIMVDHLLQKFLKNHDLEDLIPMVGALKITFEDIDRLKNENEINDLLSDLEVEKKTMKLRFKNAILKYHEKQAEEELEIKRNSDERSKYIITREDKRVTNSIVTIKLILLGDVGAGKTCIFRRFIFDHFSEKAPPTIGVDFGNIMLTLGLSFIYLFIIYYCCYY